MDSASKELLIDKILDQNYFNFMKLNLIEEHYMLIINSKCSSLEHKKIYNYIIHHERRHINQLKHKVFQLKYFVENNLNRNNANDIFYRDMEKIEMYNQKILKKYKIIMLNLINSYIEIHES